ncbi:hypothetical protein [Modicisalibacter luteus]|uniref:Uncharacterized protein n=1 Tax=Modicisalibacter luteus TaxID=453962 RepID=A0ABV7M486_9GAMM|nr:hypothetical protein [Halomonas lutea]GHA85800.1 hypothetical protein GCM10007159_03710 [Halomonas lutea]
MTTTMTPERLSTLIGVLAAIAATLPRYVYGAVDQGRLLLILMAFAVVAVVAGIAWRMLAQPARQRLPGLLGRLVINLVLGCLLVVIWQWFERGVVAPLLLLSHGTTFGLLIHAVTVGWRRRSAT